MTDDLTPIRIRIMSDGTLSGSTCVDAHSGRELICTSATWTISGDEPAQLSIVVIDFEIEAQGIVTRYRGGAKA